MGKEKNKEDKSLKITILDYDKDNFQEKITTKFKEIFPYSKKQTITWINVEGTYDPGSLNDLGKDFGFHPLLIEDITNTEKRPKIEDFRKYIFISLRMFHYENKRLISKKISIVIGSNFVISFQERQSNIFKNIILDIQNRNGRIHKNGSDYLAYALIDAIVNNYLLVLEKLGNKVEVIDKNLFSTPHKKTLQDIHNLKQETLRLRKSIWPLRETISSLEKIDSTIIKSSVRIYLRNLHEHTQQVMENIELYRETLSSMLEIYLSNSSNKMNEVMKFLTMIGTIFIPLTFITGIYGMNFKFFPELEWKQGYFIILGVMTTIALIQIIYFKKKNWIFSK